MALTSTLNLMQLWELVKQYLDRLFLHLILVELEIHRAGYQVKKVGAKCKKQK